MSKSIANISGTCLLVLAAAAAAADGSLDAGFGQGGVAFVTPDGNDIHEFRPTTAATLADGKLLLGGARNYFEPTHPWEPHYRPALIRTNADGTPDTGFGADPANPGVVVLPEPVEAMGMQITEGMQVLADGGIVIAGSAFVRGPAQGFVMKLHADGSNDDSFGERGLRLTPQVQWHDLAVDSQGRIVVCGERVGGVSFPRGVVARFLPGGEPDTAFGSGGMVELLRTENGAVLEHVGNLTTLGLLPDDRIMVGGMQQVPLPELPENNDFLLVRLNVDGGYDSSYSGDGWDLFGADWLTPASGADSVERLLVQRDGGVLFAGHYDAGDSAYKLVVGRRTASGAPDANYGDPLLAGFQPVDVLPKAGSQYATALRQQSDGKAVLSVVTGVFPERSGFAAVRLERHGTPDASFGSGGIALFDIVPQGAYADAMSLTLQAGRPVLVGHAKRDTQSNITELVLARLDNELIFADRLGD
ncbi:hypothetical protein [Tahibacter harae]|uniref:Delta-60 repeat protein n=1 Tax=Tahibacter harae TaxID=2963937 RepID=A0ABT1QNT9_9GAMM|nr:hypothetical protein [Tahibacter harae]